MWSYLAGCLIFALIGTSYAEDGSASSLLVSALIGAVFWLLLMMCMLGTSYILIPSRSRRAFRQLRSLHSKTDINWSPEGIQLRSAQGSSDLDWRDFIRIVPGRRVILLLQSDNLFNFIPVRAVSEEQAKDLLKAAATRRT